jgi:hypothetical protein
MFDAQNVKSRHSRASVSTQEVPLDSAIIAVKIMHDMAHPNIPAMLYAPGPGTPNLAFPSLSRRDVSFFVSDGLAIHHTPSGPNAIIMNTNLR